MLSLCSPRAEKTLKGGKYETEDESQKISRWEGPIRITCSLQDYLNLNHMTKSVVQTVLELWQAGCCNHFPGEPAPVTDHPLSEGPLPHVQSELPFMSFG